jgi:hypothetical protein
MQKLLETPAARCKIRHGNQRRFAACYFQQAGGTLQQGCRISRCNSDTADKALELRKELLAFSKWIGPGKTLKQVESEEGALRTRAVNFLYAEQTYWT